MRRGLIPWKFLALGALAACGGGGGGGDPVQMTITGSMAYEDRAYDANGFTGQRPQRPARFATVQLVGSDDEVHGETLTTATGSYSLTASAPEGDQVRVVLAATTEGRYNLRITNGSGRIYAVAGPNFSAAAGSRTENVVASVTNAGGAFNLLDQGIRGSDLILAMQAGASFPRLTFVWPNPNQDTSYFVGNTNSIFVLDVPSDTDQYDDDVVLHEFGHYVSHNFSWDTSPGGSHNPFDNDPEPPALAWSEGFAHWITTESRGNSQYVDTNSGRPLFFELEGPSVASVTRGAGNEIAVGAILWDITDPANEGHDSMAGQRAALWDVLGPHFRAARPSTVDVNTLCSGWFSRGHGQAGPLGAVFNHRGVRCP